MEKFDFFEAIPGGFFIYRQDNEKIQYINEELIHIFGCDTKDEFMKLTGGTFKGLVHPDDYDTCTRLINNQIDNHSRKMDYVEYRIIDKLGEIHYVEDYGHLVTSNEGNLFYVFITDVTNRFLNRMIKNQAMSEALEQHKIINRALESTLYLYREIYTIDLKTKLYKIIYPTSSSTNTIGNYDESLTKKINLEIIDRKFSDYADTMRIDNISMLLKNMNSCEFKYRRKYKDNYEWVSTTFTVETRDILGNPEIIILGIRSIEDLMSRELDHDIVLNNALSEAKRASLSKTDFIYNISHDLRTPLNAIIGYAQIAEKKPNDIVLLNKAIKKISQASQNMLLLINNVLDISKIEAGDNVSKYTKFSIKELFDNIYEIMDTNAKANNIKLIINIKDSDVIYSDKVRLNRIFMNLISNAIKYSKEDGGIIEIVAKRLSVTGNISNYEFQVKDNGIGISEEYQKYLFTPYLRENDNTNNGTGLGLPIVKKIIDLMNGRIEVSSKKNVGTTFSVYLSFKIAQLEVKSEPIIEKSIIDRNIKVLLVDDNQVNREISKLLLNEYNITVIEAVNGQDAINKLVDENYDCILMDVQMPVMDGYEATRRIREYINKDIPIIGMSANAFAEDVDKGISSGMNDYLSKPFNVTDVVNSITKCLK